MTDIYFLKNPTNGENHRDIFIGSLLTECGRGLHYCEEHEVYELIPDEYLDKFICFIKEQKNDGLLKPKAMGEEAGDLIETIINSIDQEIEEVKSNGERTSFVLNERITYLLESIKNIGGN